MQFREPTIGLVGRSGPRISGAWLALTLRAVLFTAAGQAQTIDWVRSAGATLDDFGRDLVVDTAGNSYVTGEYEGAATFGPFTLTSAGGKDIFVVKYDGSGDVVWARSAGGVLNDVGFGIAVDTAGNCFVTGTYDTTAMFGPVTLTSVGFADIFVAKYDAGGNVLWAQSAGGASCCDEGHAISVDAAGNSYVTGQYLGTATFGPFTLPQDAITFDIFIVKYDVSGNEVWARAGGESFFGSGLDIAADAAGNSYVTGFFTTTATFGSFTLTSAGTLDIFVVKYDTSGSALWARSAGGPSSDAGAGIAVTPAGNSYVAGSFETTAIFGPFTLHSAGMADIFVAKYDGSGNVLWVRSAGGKSDDRAIGLAVDTAGNGSVTGGYEGTATFGPFTLTSAGVQDIFVAKYDNNGDALWAQSAGGTSVDIGIGIGVDAAGNSYATGRFAGTASFGPFTLTSAGATDIFVAKYAVGGGYPHTARKNRYISFVPDPANVTPHTYQVTHVGSGVSFFISTPRTTPPEIAGLGYTFVVSDTDPAGLLFDFGSEPIVHVGGCLIAPGETYEIRATMDGVSFSAPLTVTTASLPTNGRFWADAVGVFSAMGDANTTPPTPAGAWTPPDGTMNGFDVTAAIRGFQKTNQPDNTWTDLNPLSQDRITNGNDILRFVNAFSTGSGKEFYPFPTPASCTAGPGMDIPPVAELAP